MSTFNQRDLYTMAIISGLLASGGHTLHTIDRVGVCTQIGAAADALVFDRVEAPAHACSATQDAVIECLTHFMSEPRTLSRVLEHLTQLGFAVDVARYAYSAMVEDGELTLDVVGGVPVLAWRGAQS
jgi:hypothetical protein